ncbi:hypothetical protein Q3C01_11880 [Bradyrhizobium sp. UFLA05-109]
MMRLPATVSAAMFVSMLGLAVLAMPTTSFAQSSGGTGGSSSATSANGPGGTGATSGVAPPPGTNSLGTAQSSGGTVGMGSGSGDKSVDSVVNAENKKIDKTVKSICRGC